ncbi:MAG: hypothetical protein J3R72DRAFT_455231 [Linnemannia gamsii]|nr:MAG: hypothetical protein J3R72DRAFT_455231 [Linnemannia gamsii]
MLRFVGVDLRENSFAVGYVNAKGKIELIPNEEGELYTPTEVRFIEGGRRAVIGRGAWEKDQNGSVVDLAGMRYPETYYTYPEGVRFSLSRDYRSTEAEEYYRVSEREHMTDKKEISSYRRYMAPDMTEKEVQESPMRLHEMRNNQGGDILAVVMRRAMDIVEARLPEGEKVERVVLTLPHGTEEEPRDPYSMPAGLMSDRSMEMTKAMLAMPMKSLSHHFETLALAVAHVEYFESRVQVDPRGGEEGEDMYLSQMVLLYNLRDKTEDLVVMEYFKGEFKGPFVFNQNPAFEHSTFHIKELGGYLPHEERIEDGFRSFVMMACLDRFNRGVGATGGDLKSKERVEIVDMDRFNHTVEQLDTLCETTSPTTADQDDLVQSFIELGPHSSVRLTCKQLKEIKFEFMKARLSRAVDKVLSASGLENKAAVDHLIVADASGFRGQSTQAMEAVFAAENKLAVKEVDPQTAILKGIVAAAEIASQDSILEIHMHCYRMLLANNLRMPDTKYKLLV